MTTRKTLYAAGEPLGADATHHKPGTRHGRIYGGGGGGGSSRSDSTQATTTTNTDRRMVTDGGSVGVGGDGNNVTVNSIDAGAVNAGRDVALSALANNSTNTDHLLTAATLLFSQTQKSLDANTTLAGSLAKGASAAYADAANQASGNKQLIFAAMAVVGVVAFSSIKK